MIEISANGERTFIIEGTSFFLILKLINTKHMILINEKRTFLCNGELRWYNTKKLFSNNSSDKL